MTNKVRKQIYIEPEQEILLKQMASDTGMSEAEIIREAINRHARGIDHHERRLRAWENIKAYIAKRMELGPVPGGRTWRREDLYDR